MRTSVVVPVRNGAEYLGQALGSVLDQTRPPDEVVVVDDGSTDQSVLVARRFNAAHPDRVRVLPGEGRGAAAARNLGAAATTGEALMFLDADDVLAPGTLAGLTQALRAGSPGLALAPWRRLDLRDGQWVERPASCRPRGPREHPLDAWLTGWYHPPCSVLWERGAFEATGRWDERLTVDDDGDLVLRALALGTPVRTAGHGLALYRRQPGAGTLSGRRLTAEGLESRLIVLLKLEAWLEWSGGLHRHRAALSAAFASLAHDATSALVEDAGHVRLRSQEAALRCAPGRAARTVHVTRTASRERWLRARAQLRGRLHQTVPAYAKGMGTGAATAGLRVAEAAAGCEPGPLPEPLPTPPAVSVVVPTFQRAEVLARALRSVLQQTWSDLELLVVDDGSTDGTQELVSAWPDDRVRYLRQPLNLGVSAARNRGLREARAPFVAFLDSDDEWHEDKLARQVTLMRALPREVGLVYTGCVDVADGDDRRLRRPDHRGDVHRALLLRNVLHGAPSSALVRRSVVAEAGFFDELIPAVEDWEWLTRVTRFCKADYVADPLTRYHDVATVGPRRSRQVSDNLRARAWFYRVHRTELRRAGLAQAFLLETVRRHLRSGIDLAAARSAACAALAEGPVTRDAIEALARTLIPVSVRKRRAAGRESAAAAARAVSLAARGPAQVTGDRVGAGTPSGSLPAVADEGTT